MKILIVILLLILSGYSTTKAQDANNWWHCPDNRLFPAVNIKQWNKVPVVNGRLPTLKETENGSLQYDFTKTGFLFLSVHQKK